MASSRPNRMQHRNHRVFGQNSHHSFLLEDFRENRYPNLQLNEIVSHVIEFARDHDGSKFIQRKLDDATEYRKDSIFREMRPYLLMLMKDTFGNFVVQKFFDIGTDAHRLELVELIRIEFMALSVHKYGCRVVQTAIEKMGTYQNFLLLNDSTDFTLLAKNANGNHVIQKCFRCVHEELKDHLFHQFQNHIYELCLDLYGCRVIQCILIHGSPIHRNAIFNEIYQHSDALLRLIQDRYGNYVIQHAIQYCAPADKEKLAIFIVQNVIQLSQQKYASNVVEKCLNYTTSIMKQTALYLICNRKSEDVKEMCIDAFGNYVVQKLIENGTDVLITNLYERVQPHFRAMRRHVCGRRIIEMLEQKLRQQALNAGTSQSNFDFNL